MSISEFLQNRNRMGKRNKKMPDYVFRLLAYRIKMGNFAEKEEVDEE